MITEEQLGLCKCCEPIQLMTRSMNTFITCVSYILGPEGDPSGAPLFAGPPAIPDGAGLRLVLSLLLLILFVRFCDSRRTTTGKLQH